MARITILMLPEPGHFLPTLRMAARLRGYGHQVTYVTIPAFRRFFLDQDFGCATILAEHLPEPPTPSVFSPESSRRATAGHLRRRGGDGSLWSALLLAMPEILSVEGDLLLCDAALAEHAGEVLGRELRGPVLAVNTSLERTHTGLPEIVLCPRELDLAAAPSPGRHYCEPSVYRGRPSLDFPWHEVRDGRPLVYCSFGSQWVDYPDAMPVLVSVVRAFADLPDCQLVVAAPGAPLVQLPRGDNVLVVDAAPQLDVLARTGLMITHGGLGSIKEAIMARVPTIVVPFMWDQPGNGRRIEHHRLGRVCAPHECDPRRVATLVTETLRDAAIRENVDRMSRVFWRREAEAPAADIVHGFVRAGRLAANG